MNQAKEKPEQVLYFDRWVDKASFRVFVYNENHEQKLAGSFKEYEDLLSSGLWYAEKPKLKSKKKIVPILTNPSEVAEVGEQQNGSSNG